MSFFRTNLKFLLLSLAIYLFTTIPIANSQENDSLIFLPIVITPPGSTTLVSISSEGVQGASFSQNPTISADGRYIAFQSLSNNLVPNDPNSTQGNDDIFVHDRQTGETKIVSVNSDGTSGNRSSEDPSISADGRYIVFTSLATNLVSNSSSAWFNIYLHDQQTSQTTLITTTTNGNGISFASSKHPFISPNGRYIVYVSDADNLVPNDTNGNSDVFLYDRNSGETKQITQNNTAAGRFLQFSPSISADGKFIVYGQNTSTSVNGESQVAQESILYDIDQDKSSVLPAPNGNRGITPVISPDGQHVIFASITPEQQSAGLFLLNLSTNELSKLADESCSEFSTGFNSSPVYSISDNSRFIAFCSGASNLVAGDSNGANDIFVYDNLLKTTRRVSVSSQNSQGNGDSLYVSISGDGRFVAFESKATSLVENDLNNDQDIFVFDRELD